MKDMLISCVTLSYTGHVCEDKRSGCVVSSQDKEILELLQYENRRRYHKVKLHTSHCVMAAPNLCKSVHVHRLQRRLELREVSFIS